MTVGFTQPATDAQEPLSKGVAATNEPTMPARRGSVGPRTRIHLQCLIDVAGSCAVLGSGPASPLAVDTFGTQCGTLHPTPCRSRERTCSGVEDVWKAGKFPRHRPGTSAAQPRCLYTLFDDDEPVPALHPTLLPSHAPAARAGSMQGGHEAAALSIFLVGAPWKSRT